MDERTTVRNVETLLLEELWLLLPILIKEVYGSEEAFWVMVAENAKDSQFDRKMILEYIYGKARDNVDASSANDKVDISIMNFFQGTPKIEENTIDIESEDEDA